MLGDMQQNGSSRGQTLRAVPPTAVWKAITGCAGAFKGRACERRGVPYPCADIFRGKAAGKDGVCALALKYT